MKMNGLFKAGFVLLLVSLVFAGAAALVGYHWKQAGLAMAAGVIGTTCALTGLILAIKSGKKPDPNPDPSDEND